MLRDNLKTLNIIEKCHLCTKGDRALEKVSELLLENLDVQRPLSIVFLSKEMQKIGGRELIQEITTLYNESQMRNGLQLTLPTFVMLADFLDE